ncbi:MAG TPA: HAD family hydrolase [Candidatus Binatus sp.]|nr:HAD family hydrolase [Candidatus Binatus sp.]
MFDLDRTLIRSQSGFNRSMRIAADYLKECLARRGHHVSRTDVYRKLRPIAKSFESRGEYIRDHWWALLLERLGLPQLKGKWLHKVTLLYWREFIAATPPYHDAEHTIRTLEQRGYRLAIVSDTDGTAGMKRTRIRALSFHHLFEAVVVAGEDTPDIKIKHTPAPFKLVARRLKLRPRMCVFVGDNPKTDVVGARRAGMQTILVKRHRLKGPKPTLVIRSLSNLLPIFSKSQESAASH